MHRILLKSQYFIYLPDKSDKVLIPKRDAQICEFVVNVACFGRLVLSVVVCVHPTLTNMPTHKHTKFNKADDFNINTVHVGSTLCIKKKAGAVYSTGAGNN